MPCLCDNISILSHVSFQCLRYSFYISQSSFGYKWKKSTLVSQSKKREKDIARILRLSHRIQKRFEQFSTIKGRNKSRDGCLKIRKSWIFYLRVLIPTPSCLQFSQFTSLCILLGSDCVSLDQLLPKLHSTVSIVARSDYTARATRGHILIFQGQYPEKGETLWAGQTP